MAGDASARSRAGECGSAQPERTNSVGQCVVVVRSAYARFRILSTSSEAHKRGIMHTYPTCRISATFLGTALPAPPSSKAAAALTTEEDAGVLQWIVRESHSTKSPGSKHSNFGRCSLCKTGSSRAIETKSPYERFLLQTSSCSKWLPGSTTWIQKRGNSKPGHGWCEVMYDMAAGVWRYLAIVPCCMKNTNQSASRFVGCGQRDEPLNAGKAAILIALRVCPLIDMEPSPLSHPLCVVLPWPEGVAAIKRHY